MRKDNEYCQRQRAQVMGEHVDTCDQRHHDACREEKIKTCVSYFGADPLSGGKNNQRHGHSSDYEVNDRGIEHLPKHHVRKGLQCCHVAGFSIGEVMWMSGNIQEKANISDYSLPANRNE